jgi:hypothetical protein
MKAGLASPEQITQSSRNAFPIYKAPLQEQFRSLLDYSPAKFFAIAYFSTTLTGGVDCGYF